LGAQIVILQMLLSFFLDIAHFFAEVFYDIVEHLCLSYGLRRSRSYLSCNSGQRNSIGSHI